MCKGTSLPVVPVLGDVWMEGQLLINNRALHLWKLLGMWRALSVWWSHQLGLDNEILHSLDRFAVLQWRHRQVTHSSCYHGSIHYPVASYINKLVNTMTGILKSKSANNQTLPTNAHELKKKQRCWKMKLFWQNYSSWCLFICSPHLYSVWKNTQQ